jgi:hypothetical protein
MAYQKWTDGGYGVDFEDDDFYHGSSSWYGYRRPVIDLAQALEPLIAHLRGYDGHRLELETAGGQLRDLKRLTEIIRQEVSIQGRYREYQVSLINQTGLRDLLRDVGDFDVHLAVRQLETRLPVYYLCRLDRLYRSEYDLVLEDLYMSPGYPLTDSRMVKLMRGGHEVYHLRLSPFRSKTEKLLGGQKIRRVDDLLNKVGRHIFQAAWHEDQRLGVMVAQEFGLPRFHEAIEVLYLCLSGELCEIRNAADDELYRFFREVYLQPAIHGFLELLPRLEGGALTHLTQAALGLYARLSQAFKRFLSVKVEWGFRKELTPLQKLVFGNFSRLAQVAARLENDPEVSAAKEVLEREAGAVVAALLGVPDTEEEAQTLPWAG